MDPDDLGLGFDYLEWIVKFFDCLFVIWVGCRLFLLRCLVNRHGLRLFWFGIL